MIFHTGYLQEEAEEMIHEADTNKDGLVDFKGDICYFRSFVTFVKRMFCANTSIINVLMKNWSCSAYSMLHYTSTC